MLRSRHALRAFALTGAAALASSFLAHTASAADPLQVRVTGAPSLAPVIAAAEAPFAAAFTGTELTMPATWPGSTAGIDALKLPVSDPESAVIAQSGRILAPVELEGLLSFKVAEGGNGGIHFVVRDPAVTPRTTPELVRADDFINFLYSGAGRAVLSASGYTPVDPGGSVPPFPDWDVNLNGQVSISDVSPIGQAFGQSSDTPGWLRADVNNDGVVSISDISPIGQHWAEVGFVRPETAPVEGGFAVEGAQEAIGLMLSAFGEFLGENPSVAASFIGWTNSGIGLGKLAAGEVNLAPSSRQMSALELEQAGLNGITPVELAIAYQALAVVVGDEVSFTGCLTLDELHAIWKPGSTISNWSQVRDGFPSLPLTLYGPEPFSDVDNFRYFNEVVNGNQLSSRNDYIDVASDAALAGLVAGGASALGYLSYPVYAAAPEGLKLLAVDAGGGCTSPDSESIEDGSYALARQLFLYADSASLQCAAVFMYVFKHLELAPAQAGAARLVPLSPEHYAAQVQQVRLALE